MTAPSSPTTTASSPALNNCSDNNNQSSQAKTNLRNYQQKKKLRVVTWNVFTGSPMPWFIYPLRSGSTRLQGSERLQRQLKAVRALNADILCLQELYCDDVLQSYRKEFENEYCFEVDYERRLRSILTGELVAFLISLVVCIVLGILWVLAILLFGGGPTPHPVWVQMDSCTKFVARNLLAVIFRFVASLYSLIFLSVFPSHQHHHDTTSSSSSSSSPKASDHDQQQHFLPTAQETEWADIILFNPITIFLTIWAISRFAVRHTVLLSFFKGHVKGFMVTMWKKSLFDSVMDDSSVNVHQTFDAYRQQQSSTIGDGGDTSSSSNGSSVNGDVDADDDDDDDEQPSPPSSPTAAAAAAAAPSSPTSKTFFFSDQHGDLQNQYRPRAYQVIRLRHRASNATLKILHVHTNALGPAVIRAKQITEVIEKHAGGGNGGDDDDFYFLLGDFNDNEYSPAVKVPTQYGFIDSFEAHSSSSAATATSSSSHSSSSSSNKSNKKLSKTGWTWNNRNPLARGWLQERDFRCDYIFYKKRNTGSNTYRKKKSASSPTGSPVTTSPTAPWPSSASSASASCPSSSSHQTMQQQLKHAKCEVVMADDNPTSDHYGVGLEFHVC